MLKIKLNSLINALEEVSVVASSVTLSEQQRTIVFIGEKDKLFLFATSTTSDIRYEIDKEDFDLTDEEFVIQIKIKELQALVGTLDPSTTEYIELEIKETRLEFRATITSMYGDSQPINVTLDLIVVPSTLKDNAMFIPIAEKEVSTEILSIYLDYLLPSLDSVEQSLDSSKMMFGSEAVFTLSGGSNFTYMKSKIPEEFEDIILGRTSLLVIQSIFKEYPSVKLLRENETSSLILMADNITTVCAFKKLSSNRTFENYMQYVEKSQADNYLGFDRQEFLDILKRLAIFDESITLEIKDVLEPYELEVNKEYFPTSYIEKNHPYLLVEDEDNSEEDELLETQEEETDKYLDYLYDDEEYGNELIVNPTIPYVKQNIIVENKEDSEIMSDFIKENSEITSENIVPLEQTQTDAINVKVTQEIVLSSRKFKQSIPVLYTNGDIPNNVKVTMKRVEHLRKSVLGSDSTASEVLLLGVKSEPNVYGITIYDSYELWFSYFIGEK